MELLQQYTFQIVALGTVMLGLVCGVIGTFAVLRQECADEATADTRYCGNAPNF